MQKRILKKGEQFGNFKFIKETRIKKYNNSKDKQMCLVECTLCGNEKEMFKSSLMYIKKIPKYCTCHHIKHGLSQDRIYYQWGSMKGRCENDKHISYSKYGGKGIKILWKNFDEYKNDMYKSYLKHCKKYGYDNTTLDRIDGNGNYCKENCRWVTKIEQSNNMNNNATLTYKGETLTLREWSQKIGVSYQAIRGRRRRGWSDEKIITTPQLYYKK